MRRGIPPLPQYAIMTWCSVKEKAQGQLVNNFLQVNWQYRLAEMLEK